MHKQNIQVEQNKNYYYTDLKINVMKNVKNIWKIWKQV